MLLLASPDDVAVRLGRLLTSSEDTRADPLLEEASALVVAWIGHTPDPVPDAVRIVVSRMVSRVLNAADSEPESGVSTVSMTAGPFGFTRGYTPDAGGVRLSRPDKIMLGPHRRRRRAGSIATA